MTFRISLSFLMISNALLSTMALDEVKAMSLEVKMKANSLFSSRDDESTRASVKINQLEVSRIFVASTKFSKLTAISRATASSLIRSESDNKSLDSHDCVYTRR